MTRETGEPLETGENVTPEPAGRVLSGRWIVLGMVAFGLLATGVMWLYWNLHTAPFLPLQQAIAGEFEGSAPLVQGGQRKIHKHSPRILRITMRVDFDPLAEANQERVDSTVARLETLVRENMDASRYERLEVHLFRKIAEKEAQTATIVRPLGGV